MPAPPKFRNGAGNIGIVEVLQKLKAKHPPKAAGHIRITGKIKVDLQRVGGDADPGGKRSRLRLQQFP